MQVFTFEDWERYHSSNWRHRIEPVTFLRVASGFTWQITFVAVLSVAVGLWHLYLVPRGYPGSSEALGTSFNMMTFSLSLLLVFKITASYKRWWEARVLWGQTIGLTRSFLQQVLLWTPAPTRARLGPIAVRWTIASMYVLKAHIRKGGDKLEELQDDLPPNELAYLASWNNGPLGVAHVWTWIVQESGMHPQLQAAVQLQVSEYVLNAAGCERILKTPMPVAFTRLTSRFLMLYLTGAPIVLWPATGWATILVAPFLAFLLLGVENIAVQIEQAFNVLPLEAMCATVKRDCKELSGRFVGTVDAAMSPGPPPGDDPRPGTKPTAAGVAASCSSSSLATTAAPASLDSPTPPHHSFNSDTFPHQQQQQHQHQQQPGQQLQMSRLLPLQGQQLEDQQVQQACQQRVQGQRPQGEHVDVSNGAGCWEGQQSRQMSSPHPARSDSGQPASLQAASAATQAALLQPSHTAAQQAPYVRPLATIVQAQPPPLPGGGGVMSRPPQPSASSLEQAACDPAMPGSVLQHQGGHLLSPLDLTHTYSAHHGALGTHAHTQAVAHSTLQTQQQHSPGNSRPLPHMHDQHLQQQQHPLPACSCCSVSSHHHHCAESRATAEERNSMPGDRSSSSSSSSNLGDQGLRSTALRGQGLVLPRLGHVSIDLLGTGHC
ncbi:MAG: hypothetical protein WDW36_010082 [Sanguina aurantia]